MAIRERGGMWCPACKRPVAARKNGHAVRNVGGVLGAVPTLGLSLLGTKSERWHCPVCGGPVERQAFRKAALTPIPAPAPSAGMVTLTLTNPGRSTIQTIKVYRKATHASLRDAKAAIDMMPAVVGHFPPQEATRLREAFNAAGATVQVATPVAAPEPPAAPATTPVIENGGVAAELAELARLRESGALSSEEFAAAKARVLAPRL